jgi:polysaccharide chain length determinant protein (PEP-CTERM system associated)
MEELIRQILVAARGMWHRRLPGLIAAWIAGVIGAIIVFQLPDKYEASARVYVDTDSVLRPLMAGLTIQPDMSQRVSILSRTLISRPNVEKLIRMTDLDHKLTTPAQKEKLVEELTGKLTIQAAGVGNLYSINFRDPSPEQARRIVQALLSIFMESSLGDKRQDSSQAREFIEGQITLYEGKLRDAENRQKEFRLRNLGLLSSSGQDYFSKMEALANETNSARMQLREAEMSRDALRTQIMQQEQAAKTASQEGKPAAPTDIPIPEIDTRLQELKRDLDELLRKYTDLHPDVIYTRRLISDLEEDRKREVEARLQAAAAAGDGTSTGSVQDVVLQQLKVGLAEGEANVAALRARVNDYEVRYKQLREAAETLPQIDAEMAQLNRDYDVIKQQYDSLVQRRESASMTGELEQTGELTDFRIIDPPRVGTKPAAPNRLLLIPLVLLAALAIGAGVSFLISQILPTFHDTRTLREITKRPLLGAVAMIERPALAKARRRRNLVFYGGLGGLTGSYAMLILAVYFLPWF